jgi:hypothetical protein
MHPNPKTLWSLVSIFTGFNTLEKIRITSAISTSVVCPCTLMKLRSSSWLDFCHSVREFDWRPPMSANFGSNRTEVKDTFYNGWSAFFCRVFPLLSAWLMTARRGYNETEPMAIPFINFTAFQYVNKIWLHNPPSYTPINTINDTYTHWFYQCLNSKANRTL